MYFRDHSEKCCFLLWEVTAALPMKINEEGSIIFRYNTAIDLLATIQSSTVFDSFKSK